MRIYVIRHGATELNKKHLINSWIDEPLIDEGREQARKVMKELPADVRAIYTSPLKRAKETAEIINERFHVPIVQSEKLREISLGTLAGKSFREIEKEHGPDYSKAKYVHLQYDYRPFNGESVEEVRARVHSAIAEIKDSHQQGPILLIGHGGTLRILEHDYNEKFIEGALPNTHIVQIEV